MKTRFKIFATNWIHLPGFYITTYLSFILFKLLGLPGNQPWDALLLHNIYGLLVLFLFWGLFLLVGFYLLLGILDAILFSKKSSKVKEGLLIEWIIISLASIFCAFKFNYWLWVTLPISFYITQMMRMKKIKMIIEKN